MIYVCAEVPAAQGACDMSSQDTLQVSQESLCTCRKSYYSAALRMAVSPVVVVMYLAVAFVVSGCGGGGGGGGDSVNLDEWETAIRAYEAAITLDLDGDGFDDIVLAEWRVKAKVSCNQDGTDLDCKIKTRDQHLVTVYLQDDIQPGEYLGSQNYNLESMAYMIASEDFDQDGIRDLALPQTVDGSVRIFSQYISGADGFLSSTDHDTGNRPVGIAAGDLTGDDLPDIVVGGDVLVLLENSQALPGNVFSMRSLGIAHATSVAMADIDRDGRNDLALTAGDSAIVLLQDPHPAPPGNFSNPVSYPSGIQSADVAVSDLNNDSLPDLAVANRGDISGTVSLLMQNPLNT